MMWPFTSSAYPSFTVDEVRKMQRDFDYVVVGGGTAGCCLAGRLSEDPNTSVLLIERGDVADSWSSRVPLISANFYRDDAPARTLNTEPCASLNERGPAVWIGNGLGGGSRINGCVYARTPREFHVLEKAGRVGWDYQTMEPYFTKTERALSREGSAHRGSGGPWTNQPFRQSCFNVLDSALAAAKIVGIPFIRDLTAPDAPSSGHGTVDLTIDESKRRVSTYEAFLPASVVRERKNLVICVKTVVARVLFSEKDTPVADRVVINEVTSSSDSAPLVVNVKKEVILCAGAIGSPHILMLSGVGPRAHLTEHDVKVVKDSPGVGSYLKDHPGIGLNYEVPMGDSIHALRNHTLRVISELLKYITSGTGLLTVPFMQHMIYTHTSFLDADGNYTAPPDSKLEAKPTLRPDTEVMPIPNRVHTAELHSPFDKYGMFAFLIAHWTPNSHGSVRLKSTDPLADPAVHLNFLSNEADVKIMCQQVRFALQLAKETKAQGYPLKERLVPENAGDEAIVAFLREHLRSSYHMTSTCRMAPEDDKVSPGVVDDRLRVWGVKGLRVCDASVFPDIVATHPMATIVAFAERCADLVREDNAKGT